MPYLPPISPSAPSSTSGSGVNRTVSTTYLPPVNWTSPASRTEVGVVPRATLAKAAQSTSVHQVQLVAEGERIRILYGRVLVAAQLACVLAYAGKLVVLAVWGEGEIGGVETAYIDNLPLPAGVTATHYTGTAGQTADPTMVAAFAAQSPTVVYEDTLPNIAYSVFTFQPGSIAGFPRITAVINGLEVYDPRSTLTAYSNTPALCLADAITNERYGAGLAIDDTTVETVADSNDELVEGLPRRTMGLVIDAPLSVEEAVEVMRAYAACFAPREGSLYRLVPDRPAASVRSFAHASGQIHRLYPLVKRGVRNVPTVIELRYTDTTSVPWKPAYVTVKAAGVDEGTTPYRPSSVPMDGIQNASEATRAATERLNTLRLGDLMFDMDVFDENIDLMVGLVVDVTHPVGLDAKKVRISGIAGGYGRLRLSCMEYQDAFYSDATVAEPPLVDTNLPSPTAPTAPTGLVLTEEVFQLENGIYASRVKATWTTEEEYFLAYHRITLLVGGGVVHTGTAEAGSAEYRTPALQEGVTYQVDVSAVSTLAESDKLSDTITIAGKALIPGPVPEIRGFEAGGIVFLEWDAATDIDIWRYELRYGLTTDTWDDAVFIDLIDGQRTRVETIPAGTWRIFVKAVDSIRQRSDDAAYIDIEVSTDANAFLLDTYQFVTPTLYNMSAYTAERGGTTRYVTDFGDDIGFGHADPDNSTGTFDDGSMETKPFAVPHSNEFDDAFSAEFGSLSSITTETFDAGQELTGNWTATGMVSNLDGTARLILELSTDEATWVEYPGGAAKTTARFARVSYRTGGTMVVTGLPTIRIDAIGVTETGGWTSTLTSNAGTPYTVELEGQYAKVLSIHVTLLTDQPRFYVIDNIVLSLSGVNSFDLRVFDEDGVQQATNFAWDFEGV